MFGGNFTVVEFRLASDPEANQKVEVVNASAYMTQGKKEDDKKPLFFKLAAWKYSGRVLMGLEKKKLYIATGRWSMDWWGDNNEKSGLVFTAEDFGEKLFAPGPNQNQGYQNQGQQQGYQQNQNQGYQHDNPTYQHNQQQQGGFSVNQAPPDDDIPF